MAGYQCITILSLLAVTVYAQELIACYQRHECSSTGPVFERVTVEACCDNVNGGGQNGIGLGSSYKQDGVRGCTPCPVVLGFIPSEFTGIEQRQSFTIKAGYLSGKPPVGGLLNLQLIPGTADVNDVQASRHHIRPLQNDPLLEFQITFIVDGISQELNETFSMEFAGFDSNDDSLFAPRAPVTIGHFNGTVIDQDRVGFEFLQDCFRQVEEPNALMEVTVAKTYDVRLANPVTFRLTPLTVLKAEQMGIMNYTRPADDNVSPSIADTNDFNATAFDMTFLAGGRSSIADIAGYIPIMDDEINEAPQQVFMILLEIQTAVNPDLIVMARTYSTCIIIDNDDIQIGFAQPVYSFNEPDLSPETVIKDITLVREGGRLSEQTFWVDISVGNVINMPPATLEFDDEAGGDYSLALQGKFITLELKPFKQSVTLTVFLFRDDLPEGTEAFRATSKPSANFPNFGPPSMGGAFASTEIHIIDDELTAQERITCYQLDGCSSSGLVFERVTLQDCCDNINGGGPGGIGLGSSYQQDGVEGCTMCPVVLGFIPPDFIGIEREEDFTLQAGYLSGKPAPGGILDLQLKLGTADMNDVQASGHIRPHPTEPLQEFKITIRLDGLSQEFNETFSIEFAHIDFLFAVGGPVTAHSLNGTIIDQDRVQFELSKSSFRQQEAPNASLGIHVVMDGGKLANPVLFRVTPLTVLEAESMDIAKFARPADDDVSPSIADKNDFDATAFSVTFPVDEISRISGIEAFIPIVDDEINEAWKQVFVVLLQVEEAVNSDLITITRAESTCVIIDNDDVQIGFARPMYTFTEPDFETVITDVVIVREGDRLSEQTFQVEISVHGTIDVPPATLEFEDETRADYRLTAPANFIALNFEPHQKNITLAVILYHDDLLEGTEGFRTTCTPSPNFPNYFGPPSMEDAFASAQVLIVDDRYYTPPPNPAYCQPCNCLS